LSKTVATPSAPAEAPRCPKRDWSRDALEDAVVVILKKARLVAPDLPARVLAMVTEHAFGPKPARGYLTRDP
jgi:hypothetical protein